MSGNQNKLIAFNYFGGKFSWIDQLYAYFPKDFKHLVDVFGGSFVVSINYQGKVIKTANDLNQEVVNFFRVLRDYEEKLVTLLELTPVSLEEYNNCYFWHPDPIERARRFYVRARQSFFGLGLQRRNKGWHMAKTQVNCKGGETVSRFTNGIVKLKDVARAITSEFQITNFSYAEVINKIDFEEAFFYCDPPYPLQSRKSKNDYKHEFTDKDHIDLATRLQKVKGMAMISGYDCGLMRELYSEWNFIKFPSKLNNIRSGKVEECIWFNYPYSKTKKSQLKLF
ncbi:DNA adenine methylase [Aquimarina sp. W85]|uniref:DNA adenine methylase n=1 Tax=Aquimarina rhodophyticola TaxID=3342246 RepID=UPI0036704BF5